VILSGTLDDGAAGLRVIKDAGGLACVQDPDDALFDILPRAALGAVTADAVLPADELAPMLARLAEQQAAMPTPEGGQVAWPKILKIKVKRTGGQ